MKQLITFLLVISSLQLAAQDTTATTQFAIEVDPAPFVFNGYSFSAKYSPRKMPKVAFMASVYSSRFPDGMMNSTNRGKGWKDLHIEKSYAVFAEFFCSKERKGFYFGPSVFLYNKTVSLQNADNKTSFKTIYPNVRAGYLWYPVRKLNLYLNPWINVGSEINIDNKNMVGKVAFEPNKFTYIAALHIGYSFTIK